MSGPRPPSMIPDTKISRRQQGVKGPYNEGRLYERDGGESL